MTSLGLIALPAIAAGMTAFNTLTWPRGAVQAPGRRAAPRITVCMPARNEARNIEASVRAVLDATPPVHAVWVCDDSSTDATPDILAALQAEDDRLHLLQGTPLPPGWVGKVHACEQLWQAVQAQQDDEGIVLYLDADVSLLPEGLRRLSHLMARRGQDGMHAGVVTAVPRQQMQTWAERLILPLLHLTYTSWLPMPLVWLTQDPRFLAANGQVLAMRAGAVRAFGGFAAVADELVDDMAICRAAKLAGVRVVFADGHHIARCRMYRSTTEVWEGFSKNLYEGIGGHPLGLLAVLTLYSLAFVLPYGVLAAAGVAALVGSPWSFAWWGPAALAVALNLGTRALLAWRHKHPWDSVLLHPIGVLGLLAIAVNSWRWAQRDHILWAGRAYAAKATRSAP